MFEIQYFGPKEEETGKSLSTLFSTVLMIHWGKGEAMRDTEKQVEGK